MSMLLKEVRKLIQQWIFEGVDQDRKHLAELFPESRSELSSLPPKWIMWLNSRFGETSKIKEAHPFEDALVTVTAYSKKDSAISQKYTSSDQWRAAVDAEFPNKKWKNPADVMTMTVDDMETLLQMSQRKKQNVDASKTENVEGDKIGKIGPWNLWMPTTKENSCEIAGYDPKTMKPTTTWCTARTSGSNLFYNYVGRDNIILFYLIKDNPISENDKLSVGFVHGKPVLKGDFGGVSVNAVNKGLTKTILQEILKNDFEPIFRKLEETAKTHSGKHPVEKKFEEAAQSVESLKNMIRGQSDSEKKLIFHSIIKKKTFNSDVAKYIAETEQVDLGIMFSLLTSPQMPVDTLIKFSDHPNPQIRSFVAQNGKKLPKETIHKLLNDESEKVRAEMSVDADLSDDQIRTMYENGSKIMHVGLSKRKHLPEDVALKLAEGGELLVCKNLLNNANLSANVFNALLNNKNKDVVEIAIDYVIHKKDGISDEKMIEFANSENPNIRKILLRRYELPKYIFEKLLEDNDPSVVIEAFRSKHITEEQIRKLSKSENPGMLLAIARHDITPADVLRTLAASDNQQIRMLIAANKNTPLDALMNLARDKSAFVRYSLTRVKTIDKKVLEILINDPDKKTRETAQAILDSLNS